MSVMRLKCWELSGRMGWTPQFGEIEELTGNEEPCLLFRQAGFSKIDDHLSDRELPACLLGKVFARKTQPRIQCLNGKSETGLPDG